MSPMANPKSAKNPKVGITPTAGSTGVATVMMAAMMIPMTAPVIMNDQIRGARRMVTSVLAMSLFSQNSERQQFGEGRSGSRCADGAPSDGFIPRLVADRERQKSRGVEFNDVRRGAACVTESFDNLDRPVWGYSHLDGFARRDAREFLQDEPHGDRRRVAIRRAASNFGDGSSATLEVDSGKGHAQHASSGKGRVFT